MPYRYSFAQDSKYLTRFSVVFWVLFIFIVCASYPEAQDRPERLELSSPNRTSERLNGSWGTEVKTRIMQLIAENYVREIDFFTVIPETLKTLDLITSPTCSDDVPTIDSCDSDYVQCASKYLNYLKTFCGMKDERVFFLFLDKLLQKLDPNSCALDKDMLKELKIGTSGKFGGVGMVVDSRDGHYVVVSSIEDGPAHRAGITAGDKILAIDGMSVDGLPLNEVLKKVRGASGSLMTVSLVDANTGKNRNLKLHRRLIKVPPVKYSLINPNIGYIRIVNFQQTASEEVKQALLRLKATAGRSLGGLILDLRDNPGGIFDQAIKTAELFSQGGAITAIQGNNSKVNKLYKTSGEHNLYRGPLVILINKGTASAAEILTGALQSQKNTMVLGERSYGKASVQAVFVVNDQLALRLTTAQYVTALGKDIDGIGIDPDIRFRDGREPSGRFVKLNATQLQEDAWISDAIQVLSEFDGNRRPNTLY
jgi:carboxyl-terminal processing protease